MTISYGYYARFAKMGKKCVCGIGEVDGAFCKAVSMSPKLPANLVNPSIIPL